MEEKLAKSGLLYCIARPSVITGPGRDEPRPAERVGAGAVDAALNLAALFGAKKLRDRYHSTDNATLARALVHLSLHADQDDCIVESEYLRIQGELT